MTRGDRKRWDIISEYALVVESAFIITAGKSRCPSRMRKSTILLRLFMLFQSESKSRTCLLTRADCLRIAMSVAFQRKACFQPLVRRYPYRCRPGQTALQVMPCLGDLFGNSSRDVQDGSLAGDITKFLNNYVPTVVLGSILLEKARTTNDCLPSTNFAKPQKISTSFCRACVIAPTP
jgi:hypothetical protein